MKLSNDLIVACKIYECNKNNIPTYITFLVNSLSDQMTKLDVFAAVDNLLNTGIIHGGYGSDGTGCAKILFEIDSCHIEQIKKLYEKSIVG